MSVKIVATDGYTLNPGDNPWTEVEALGELAVYDRTAPGELIERCQGAAALIINKTKISAQTMDLLPGLRFITMAATGYDCVDIEAAGKRGIPVANVPVYGTDSVAQYVFSAVLNCWHNIGLHDQAVKAGEWAANPDWSFWKMPLMELAGKTMGIVGFGRIGRRVGELANAFGMKVMAHDVYHGNQPTYSPFEWAEIADIFAAADVVTLHCPLTPDNGGFINLDLLKRMKKSAMFINCARGPLVNEADLAEALKQGLLAHATLDTVKVEPILPDNPLLSAPNVSFTPHLAWGTLEGRQRLMSTVAENIEAFLAGAPNNLVNQKFLP